MPRSPQDIADELLLPHKKREEISPAIKKEASIKKEAKALPVKIKVLFDIKVETMLPATLSYRVLAESPEQAMEMIRNLPPSGVKHRLNGKKDLKMTVYDGGSMMVRLIKNLAGK